MIPARLFLMDGQLRPSWRFFLSVVLMFFAIATSNAVVSGVSQALSFHPSFLINYFIRVGADLLAVLAVFKLMTAVFEQKPLASMGLAFHARWRRELGHGAAIGAAMILSVGFLEWALGFARFDFSSTLQLRSDAFGFVLLGVIAIDEEVIFRGYPFQRLVEAITPAGAVALASAVFGLAHLGNPHHTWLSTANTALVGVPLAIAYLRTRSLWMPIGMHFIWNYLQGFVLGLPVSGLSFGGSIMKAQVSGADWLTGGSYGPEGGLVATFVVLAATIYVLLSKRIYVSKDMEAIADGPPSREGAGQTAEIASRTFPNPEKDGRG